MKQLSELAQEFVIGQYIHSIKRSLQYEENAD